MPVTARIFEMNGMHDGKTNGGAKKWNPNGSESAFMPATPLGEDGRRVTGSAAHIALSRRAAAEGMVLLKNENETLPLKRGSRVAVFGKAQADYVKGGGGSRRHDGGSSARWRRGSA